MTRYAKPSKIIGRGLNWKRNMEGAGACGSKGVEAVEAAVPQQTASGHALYARNLCPTCPGGAKVKSRSIWKRAFGARDVSFCELPGPAGCAA